MPVKEKVFTERKTFALTSQMKRAIEEKPYPSAWVREAIKEKLEREHKQERSE